MIDAAAEDDSPIIRGVGASMGDLAALGERAQVVVFLGTFQGACEGEPSLPLACIGFKQMTEERDGGVLDDVEDNLTYVHQASLGTPVEDEAATLLETGFAEAEVSRMFEACTPLEI